MKKTRSTGTLLGIFTAVLFLSAALPGAMAAQEPSVSAAGAVVMDFDTGEFYYEKNADLSRPVASMTKLMSLYLVFEEMEAGTLSPDSYVTAGARAAAISNNSLYSGLERLRAGENYRVEDLLRIIMTKSCNGSVLVLAEHIGGTEEGFVARMNETAARWGLNAHFADSFGFKDDGNAVSPRAMALLAQRIITDYPQILDYSSLPESTFQGRSFLSTNTLLRENMVEGIDGLKTGTTDGAGYCFTGTAQREGRRIISVVMGAASHTIRMLESQSLLEYGFACRQAREDAWHAIGESLHADITARGPLWARTEATLTATLSGLTTEAGGRADPLGTGRSSCGGLRRAFLADERRRGGNHRTGPRRRGSSFPGPDCHPARRDHSPAGEGIAPGGKQRHLYRADGSPQVGALPGNLPSHPLPGPL